MSESLQWKLTLRDDVSKPSRTAARGAAEFQRAALRLQRTQAAAAKAQVRTAAQVARLNANAFRRDQQLARSQATQLARSAAVAARASAANARSARDGQRAVSRSFTDSLGTLGRVGLGIAGIAAGIIGSFAGIGAEVARTVVQVAAFRESSLVALEAVLGSSQAAGRQFRNAIVVANQTPLDTADVIAQTQSFAIAGFSEREIQPLVAASADLGAAFGQRSSEGFSYALSQIRAAGQLQGQELLQLQNANVSREAVLASIARQMGLGTGDAGNRAALQAIRDRRVSSGVGIQAALDAVQGRLDRGRSLGSFARDQSNTLTGALSNARNAIFNLLIGIDFAKIPGVQAFKRALLAITEALQSGSPAAATLRGYITGAANAVGGLFARINPQSIAAGFGLVSRAFSAIGRFATTAYPVVRSFLTGLGPGFMAGIAPIRSLLSTLMAGGGPSATTMAVIARAALGLGQALGFVVGTVVSFVGAIGTFATVVTGLGATAAGLATSIAFPIRNAFVGVGMQIIEGIRDGIRNGVASLAGSVGSMATGAVQAARDALGIHSPSRVFRDEIGRQIPAGLELGITHGAAPVNDAVSSLANPRAMQLGGLGGVSIVAHIQVTEAARASDTAEEVLSKLEDRMGAIFGRYAEALG